jgi:biotin carboxyl carrier protein
MPGTVVKVLVKPGDRVAKGAELVLVEAMKMEIKIESPLAGVVKVVRKREGEPCDAGEILVEIEPEGVAA